MARLNREIIVTEKIDGTNASIFIGENGEFLAGSRTRWITPESDNYGFAKWAYENKEELLKLGIGHHFGEWWGGKIQRGYGIKERKFSLFNATKWSENPELPKCCEVVPILYEGNFDGNEIQQAMENLRTHGSFARDGFMNP
jgi:hypothetical protein